MAGDGIEILGRRATRRAHRTCGVFRGRRRFLVRSRGIPSGGRPVTVRDMRVGHESLDAHESVGRLGEILRQGHEIPDLHLKRRRHFNTLS
jgi:hypothetical protein